MLARMLCRPCTRGPARRGREALRAVCRLIFLAGDISPIDVLTHVPVLCEDHNVPYVYVPSKEVRTHHALTHPDDTACCAARVHPRRRVSCLAVIITHGGVQELANAGQTKRPTSCLMVLKDAPKGGEADAGLAELYGDVEAKLQKLDA